jgi:DNA-binding transcriptional LysR family regulator
MTIQVAGGDLELNLLRTFLAVVRHGSLGKTATAVDKTQPAVSQRMLRLEKIVGQRLFSRGRNGITLTRHGELLVSYANRALELNEETLARLRTEKPPERLLLVMSTVFALVGLAPTLKRLQSIYPSLELKVVVADSTALEGFLKAGKVDLVLANPGLLTGTPAAKWLVPLEWAAGKSFRPDQSQPLPLVLFEGPCVWQQEMLDSLRSAGWQWRVTFESASVDAILTAVQSDLGIAALLAETVRSSKLARVESADLPPAPKISMGTTPAEKQKRRNGDQKKTNFQTFVFHEQGSIRSRETERFSRAELN